MNLSRGVSSEKRSERLPISSVVLSREPPPAGRGSHGSPLVHDGMKLVPSITRVFRQGQEMQVYLEAYQPDEVRGERTAVSVSFYRDGVKAFETAPLVRARQRDVLPLAFRIPLSSLQPGRYP